VNEQLFFHKPIEKDNLAYAIISLLEDRRRCSQAEEVGLRL
jgi:hypothetical protein